MPSTEGKKHDAAMLAESHLYNSLEKNAFPTAGEAICIYGDPPFQNRVLTPQMLAYNSSTSAVRTAVEWLFGDVINIISNV